MKRLGILSLLTWIIFLVVIYFLLSGMYLPAIVAAAAAYLLSGLQTKIFTGRMHVVSLLAAAVLLAIALFLFDDMNPKLSLAGIACILTTLPFSARIWFFEKFTMVRFLFMEGIVVGGGVVLYCFSLDFDQNILALLAPLAPIGFTGGIAFGMFRDTPGLLKAASKGYRVDPRKPAPDFELPDQDGKPVKLSDFTGKRNLLLIFVRGDWCPWCHMMLRTYQKGVKQFEEKNIFLLAIGPDPVGINNQMAEKLGLEFKVLSDEHQQTAMLYGCQLSHEENKNLLTSNPLFKKYKDGMPLPASFLVNKNGIVIYTSRPDKIGEFLDPATIFPMLEKLS